LSAATPPENGPAEFTNLKGSPAGGV
jgi:hypothetical protein